MNRYVDLVIYFWLEVAAYRQSVELREISTFFCCTLGVRNDHKTCHMAHQTRHMVTFGRYIFNNDIMVSLWCLWSIYIIYP